MRIAILVGVIVLGWSSTALGQTAVDPSTVAAEVPAAATGGCVAVAPARDARAARAATRASKYDLVIEAARHLEAAGVPEEARQLRRQIEQDREALTARLAALQNEAERLRVLIAQAPQAPGQVPQILVRMKILEFRADKLRALGFDFAKVARDDRGVVGVHKGPVDASLLAFAQLGKDDAALGAIDALHEEGLVRVLAAPTMVTLSGRAASVAVGAEIPAPNPAPNPARTDAAPVEPQFCGTRVDVLPTLSGDQKVKLELHCRLSELDPAYKVVVGKMPMSVVRTREVQTTAEIPLGQTLVIGGLTQTRPHDPPETVQLVILITPELVSPLEGAQAHSAPWSPAPQPPSPAVREAHRLPGGKPVE